MVFLLYVLAAGCHRSAAVSDDQDMATPEQHPDEHAAMAAEHAMAGMVSNEDFHMRLTPQRPSGPGDSARVAAVLAVMRRDKKASGGLTFVLRGPDGLETVEDPPAPALDHAFRAVGVDVH